MFKKLIAGIALFATLSQAAWDNVPILKKGSGQVAAEIEYLSMDPISGIALGAGVRYSALNWLELSAILPYGFFSADTKEGSQDFSGLMNMQLGVRFQITQGFGLYADALLPGNSDVADDQLSINFGLQHSNLFTSITWAKYLGYMLGDAWSNQYLYFGTELQFLFDHFVIYGDLKIIMGQESDHYSCSGYSYTYHCEGETGGQNGISINLGFKLDLSEQFSLDFGVNLNSGDRFTRSGTDEPTAFSVTGFYNF